MAFDSLGGTISPDGSSQIKTVTLAGKNFAAPIFIDKEGSAFDGLSLIADAISDDIEALCGKRPETVFSEPKSGVYIVAGLVSDDLIKSQGVNWQIEPSCGDFKSPWWERYQIKVLSEADRTKVVIAGTDKRGAIYGLFHITQDIFGVSPWIWWADVKPKRRESLTVPVSELETVSKRPSVTYRGFFMNDENPCFDGFADSHFGGLNYMFYDEVFKLILRLRGNYMWPAMWSNDFSRDGMEGVNSKLRFKKLEKKYHHKLGGLMYVDNRPNNAENIPYDFPSTDAATEKEGCLKAGEYPMTLANAVLADRYGITVGASHHEPMARSGREWGILQGYHSGRGTYHDSSLPNGKPQQVWNYLLNKKNIESFWSDGVYRNGGLDTMFTVGMRGENDSVLIDNEGKTLTTEDNIELLKAVLRKQQEILERHGVGDSPSLIAVYKEVENCWYGGSRDNPKAAKGLGLRDDPEVTELLGADTNKIVMLCEDNNGYLRTLPDRDEMDKFNWGLYYHFDYVGAPRTSMWINTMPLQRAWENLTAAYEYGVNDCWIVNVGDIKPMELPLSYFMQLAYDYDSLGQNRPNSCDGYIKDWTKAQFSNDVSDSDKDIISSLLRDYAWLNGVCKPETLKSEGEFSYSPIHYGEAQKMLSFAENIIERANDLAERITPRSHDYIPFYQLAYYPAVASANVVRIQILRSLNRLSASRGSVLANDYADAIEKYLAYDEQLSRKYCSLGEKLSGISKWYGIMLAAPDYTKRYHDKVLGKVAARPHMNYSSWNTESAVKIVPDRVSPLNKPLMVVDLPSDEKGYTAGTARLREFESIGCSECVIGISNGGKGEFTVNISSPDSFIVVESEPKITVSTGTTVKVRINWDEVDEFACGTIILKSGRQTVEIEVKAVKKDTSIYKLDRVHIPSHGFTVMRSDEYAKKGASCGAEFDVIDGYGKSGASVKVFPALSDTFEAGKGPWIDYNFAVDESGDYRFTFYVGQNCSLSFDEGEHLNMGVQIDGGEIQVVNALPKGYVAGSHESGDWCGTIQRAGRTVSMESTLKKGEHTLRIWAMDYNLVLQKTVVARTKLAVAKSLLGPEPTPMVNADR